MPDWLSPDQRRRNMRAIRARGTRPELVVADQLRIAFPHRRILFQTSLPGRPDFYLPALRLAVFVDGCYWHGCPDHGRIPADNRSYWEAKLEANRRRDRAVTRKLREADYSVVRVWEHDARRASNSLVTRLRRAGSSALRRHQQAPHAATKRASSPVVA